MGKASKLLVGAVVVGAAGLAWYSCNKTAAAKDRDTTRALAYVPADAELVIGFDFDGFRDSEAFDMLKSRLEVDPSYRAMRKSCDVDFMSAIPRITIAIRDTTGRDPVGVFVLQGRNVDKLVDCMAKHDSSITKDGNTWFVREGRRREAAMRLVDSETLVAVFGDSPTKAELDEVVTKSARSITSVTTFDEIYDRVDTTDTAWFVMKGSLLDDAPLGPKPRAVGGSIDIGKQISGKLMVRFDSAKDAEELVGDSKQVLRLLDDAVKIDRDGADVTLSFEVSPATTKDMIKSLGVDW